jgi:hypothetical protein
VAVGIRVVWKGLRDKNLYVGLGHGEGEALLKGDCGVAEGVRQFVGESRDARTDG